MKYLKIFEDFTDAIDSIEDDIIKIRRLVLLCLVEMIDNGFDIKTSISGYNEGLIAVTIQSKLKNSDWGQARRGFEFDESIISLYKLLRKRYNNVNVAVHTTSRTDKNNKRLPNLVILGELPTLYARNVIQYNNYIECSTLTDFLKNIKNLYLQKVEILVS